MATARSDTVFLPIFFLKKRERESSDKFHIRGIFHGYGLMIERSIHIRKMGYQKRGSTMDRIGWHRYQLLCIKSVLR